MTNGPLLPVVVIALAATSLAGCTGPGNDAAWRGCVTESEAGAGVCQFMGEADMLIQGDSCHGSQAGRCSMEDGILIVRGLNLQGQGEIRGSPQSIGLLVDGLTVPLRIESLQAAGFWTGVHIGATCPGCSVELSSTDIRIGAYGIQIGAVGETKGAVTVQDARLHLDRPGMIPVGILMEGRTGDIHLNNVEIVQREPLDLPLLSPAVWQRGAGNFTASHLRIHGFPNAMHLVGPAIHLSSTEIQCTLRGISLSIFESASWGVPPHKVTLEASDLSVQGCIDAVTLGSDLIEPSGGPVRFSGLTLRDNSHGLYIGSFQSVSVEDFIIADNTESGITVIRADTIDLVRGVLEKNGAWGARLGSQDLRIDGVAFIENGISTSTTDYGGLQLRSDFTPPEPLEVVVRNSSFVGNHHWGILDGMYPVDARYNWWGSALGPTPPSLVGVPGLGDIHGPLVVAVPYLTEPP